MRLPPPLRAIPASMSAWRLGCGESRRNRHDQACLRQATAMIMMPWAKLASADKGSVALPPQPERHSAIEVVAPEQPLAWIWKSPNPGRSEAREL